MTTTEWCRAAARRISRGSGRLTTLAAQRTLHTARGCWARVTGWVGRASGIGWVLRVAVLVAPSYLLRHQALALAGGVVRQAEAASGLLWPLAIVWVVAAYRIGRADWSPADAPAAEQEAAPEGEEQPPAEETPASPEEPHLPRLADVRDAVTRVGTPHVHVTVLAEELGTTPDRVREALAQWAIPVEPVRMRGRGSSTGVKGDRFPAPATPSDGVVAAGQATNNNDNNVRVERHAGGAHITVTPPRRDTAA
ncbi:hypothetical protein ABT185_07665 [Streptomyces clavifer]|uniref:hypothetical protein n=1 Tax=Streptomyces clavifer TaxID=68188 RepID=UPI0033225354